MRVLVACEFSGIVREAFSRQGHIAVSCDLLPTENRNGRHIQGNVLDELDGNWDLMIAFPPCTYLAVSGARWFSQRKKEMNLFALILGTIIGVILGIIHILRREGKKK